ncbi:HlyD family type I secretion periplasmic adaptor subunit [uncultured Roseibium sp.]|uniref:HlyD family type I secretion periplasmic adaptor subunit n=1 Tax=uncultured Roseibium sp. TaxID=1936171 RepID=UPI0025927D68|nr:HlyD family type I secretion periplasmic adaptor subunit [uncultured Roseibium sp.]
MNAEPGSDAHLKRTVRAHLLAVLLISLTVVVGLGGWLAVARISGAVVTSGTVVVESNIKQVQHQEGGIVREIKVDDGDLVEAGELLLRLDDTVTRANLAVITKQLAELEAQEKRLLAERDGGTAIAFLRAGGTRRLTEVEIGQKLLFEARRNSLSGQRQQLSEQITQLDRQIEGLEAQLDAKAQEIELIDLELVDLNALLAKQLVSKSRVTSLRREKTRLRGEHGSLIAQIAQAREAISEREIQILQIDENFRAEVLEQLQEVRSELARLAEQRIAAEDQLQRVDLRAPQTGYVHQLAVHTIGGVVAAGEPVMLVVPREDKLVVEAQIRPVDIDQLGQGQQARVRFPSFDQRTTPELNAHLLTISADLTEDERTGLSYYTARLAIDEAELSKLNGAVLVPGMPVEAFMTTQERSVLSYLIKPVIDQITHAMRER